MTEALIDGFVFFVTAFVILTIISLIGAGVRWLWKKVIGEQE